MSVFTDTASVVPNPNALRTMRRYFPEWTEQNLTAPQEVPHRGSSQAESISASGNRHGYQEFLLSSNWVLRPDGLREFFSEFTKRSLNSEITWDATLGCFRVRLISRESLDFMTAVREILDYIVQPEIDNVPESERYGAFGHVTDWRTAAFGEDELKAYDKFSYPRELMELGHQDTWHMPTGQVNAGVTIARLLPTNRLMDELQKSSRCTVMVGMDGKSLQVGGMTENDVEVAKKKMDRLSKYYGLTSDSDMPGRHVLYAGSDVAYMAEMRYLFHVNEGLLSTIFLDRTRCLIKPGKTTYSRVFSRGSVVTKALYDYASKGYQSMPQPNITPAFEKSKAASAFIPFKGYRYSAKTSTWVPDDLSATASQPSSAVVADFSSVNPQLCTQCCPFFARERQCGRARVMADAAPLPSTRIIDGEQQSREFHATMEQRAPSKKPPMRQTQGSTAQRPDPSPDVIGKVSNKLVKILEPLRMFQGAVSLKAELGRFIFTNMNPAHVSLPHDVTGPPRYKSPDEMEMSLERHSNTQALLFTRVISLSGGDMNYIADLREPGDESSRVWMPSRRSVIYEFRCQTSTVDKKSRNCFIVDVNSENFSFRLRPDPAEGSKGGAFMHCLGRTFDIQFTVDTAPNLTEDCSYFAQELVESLTVKTNGTGVPQLSFINHGDWHAMVRSVRIRRAAVYSNSKHQCELEITQVTDMSHRVDSVKNKVNYLVAEEGGASPTLGIFPVFYEACIKSTKAERAFAENKSLEFAEEAGWSGKDLKAAGVFKDLISSATSLVKRMDSIGYWCDNQQKAMLHGRPPMSTAEVGQRASDQAPPQYNFW
ncbi:hypothetical protein PG997_004999 [Apiospora hydei]|uniref:DUF7905 domain-containing protein n=1 Tax=Apiospora hydei TaxID=1337664 RepID=A0ABR1X3P0_9PEZI